MSRTYYHKLIRDRIPEVIKANGGSAKLSVLDDRAFEKALKEKLVEEAQEVLTAQNKEEVVSELGDVLEVLDAIMQHYGFSFDHVQACQGRKKVARGGFEKKLFLAYVDKA